MAVDKLINWGFFLLVLGFVVFKVVQVRLQARGQAKAKEKGEALFRSMFPELQPHYHPLKLLDFVRARRSRKARAGAWRNPPGFATDSAETILEDGKERVRLRDATGTVLGEFVFEEHPEGGVLRVGKGKLTVSTKDAASPRVRYWHPDREFKWKRGVWTFQSRIAEREIESGDRTSFSNDSSSSSSGSSMARGAAVAGGIVAAGGAFDGGGANASWDGASGESASQGSGGSGAFEGGASESSVSSSPAY